MNISNYQNINKILVVNKILVFRLSSMGDVILTTPVVRLLRNAFPNAIIDFVTAKEFVEIYKHNPHINQVYEYDKTLSIKDIIAWRNQFVANKNDSYDLFIDLQKNIRSKIFKKSITKKTLQIKKNRLQKLSLVYLKKQLFGKISQIPLNNINTLSSLSITDDGNGLELWLPEETSKGFYPPESACFPRKGKTKIKIAVSPGAYHKTKKYPVDKLIEVLHKIHKVLKPEFSIIGGTKDIDVTYELKSGLSFPVADYTGSTSIIDTTRKISACDLLLTNDTGVMHIAAARQVPVVAIFGSTVSDFGFSPYRVKHKIVENEVKCRPCSHIGRSECPKGHFDCMLTISPEKVANTVIESLLE